MKKMWADLLRSIATALWLPLWLSACGGGSGDATQPTSPTPPSQNTPPSIPVPAPAPVPQANRPPVVMNPITDQRLVTQHAFTLDISRGGTAVTDPDGDPLTYTLRETSGTSSDKLPPGLSVSGTVISGVPTQSGYWSFQVDVDDNRPGSTTASFQFQMRIADNQAPVLVSGNIPQLFGPGTHVDYDAAKNGTAFADPDGDVMTYSVVLRGNPQGLTIVGTHLVGTLATVGAVEATITATDPYGASTSNSFLLAAPAAESTAIPVLPTASYVYRDEDLPLPFVFRDASESKAGILADRQPADNRSTNAGSTLGRVLFYDKRLSITNTVACASCHDQSHGFASSVRFDVGVLGIPLKRNSMALANARYNIQGAWFSDMRIGDDLRNLIFMPIDNHDELGMSLFSVESKLQTVPFYAALFSAAFGTPDITRDRIAAALAQFVQSLISYQSKSDLVNSPTDNGPGPDPATVFNAQEVRGLEIFKNNCAICHEVQAATNRWQANNGLDLVPSDIGTTNPELQRDGTLGIFRAASLRNIAVSGPYMHDGRFSTLREVIDHYDSGVQDARDLDHLLRVNSYGPPIRLNLSESDKQSLEAFLNTFTDSHFLNDPKFSNPFPP